jgi:hypothetical protein
MVSPEATGLSGPSERRICGHPIMGWCVTRSIRWAATAGKRERLTASGSPGNGRRTYHNGVIARCCVDDEGPSVGNCPYLLAIYQDRPGQK